MRVLPVQLHNKQLISHKGLDTQKQNVSQVFSSFKNIQQNLPVTNTQIEPKKLSKKAKVTIIIGSVAAAAAIAAVVLVRKDKIKNIAKAQEIENIIKEDVFKFDKEYKEKLLKALNLEKKDAHKISSIMGEEELLHNLKNLNSNPEKFSPGLKQYNPDGTILEFAKENLKNGNFAANLHVHTQYSDGKLTVPELLEQAVKYADKRAAKTNDPFILAITDHDTVQGCKEALNIIKEAPEKFKNLKLILGCEHTAIYKDNEFLSNPVSMHVLSYGINPFSSEVEEYLGSKIQKNSSAIKKSIEAANFNLAEITYDNKFKYSFDEVSKMMPFIKYGLKNSDYTMKDYYQFKLIFSEAVTNNKELTDYLAKNSLNVDFGSYNLFDAVKKIPKELDYSNGQKYWEYYYTALKGDIIRYLQTNNKNVDEIEILRKFKPLKEKTKYFLNTIENDCLNPKNEMFVPKVEHPDFKEALSEINKFKDGFLSMAHPGVVFPVNAMPEESRMVDFYKKVFDDFKQIAPEKAKAAEYHYQSYYKTNDTLIPKLKELAKKFNLIGTGGLDSHNTSIFSI